MNKFLTTSILFLILLVGCSEQASLAPVAIDENVDSCAACNMGIREVDHASQIIFKDGTPYKYDDIGCMLTDLIDSKEELGIAYVHDFNSGEWIDMNEATFIHENNISTPMSYGIIAFHSEEEAKDFQAEHGGEVYRGDEVLQVDIQSLKHTTDHDHHAEMSDSHE